MSMMSIARLCSSLGHFFVHQFAQDCMLQVDFILKASAQLCSGMKCQSQATYAWIHRDGRVVDPHNSLNG